MTAADRIKLAFAAVYGRGPLQFAGSKVTSTTEGKVFTPSELMQHMGIKNGPDPESYSTGPEKNFFLNHASKGLRKKVAGLANAATDPGTYAEEKAAELAGTAGQKFNTVIPTTNTIEQVAKLGGPAKGEYQNTFNTVVDLFGHHPYGVPAWVSINAGLSPNAAYPDHAAAATHLTANWLALPEHLKGNESAIRQLMKEAAIFGKHGTQEIVHNNPDATKESWDRSGGMSFKGTVASTANENRVVTMLQNIDKMKAAMEHPEDPEAGQWLGLLSGKGPKAGMLKVPNFFASYHNQLYGTAIDTHMNRLLIHPNLSMQLNQPQILQQIEAAFPPDDARRLKKLILSKKGVSSELVKELMSWANNPDPKINKIKLPFGTYLKTGKGEQNIKGGVYDEAGKLVPGTGMKKLQAIPAVMKIIGGKLSANPAYYAAYKHALADAGTKMGWNPSEVQETVWTGLVALMAANGVSRDTGIPVEKVQDLLTQEAIRKGWENHGAFYFPSLVDAYVRAGSNPEAVARVEARARGEAASQSRPGIIQGGLGSGLRAIAARLPGSGQRGDAALPIRQALIKILKQHGLLDSKGKMKLRAIGQAIRLAAYDAPLPLPSVLQRVTSSNQKQFAETLKKVLMQSGVTPHEVQPAIHDVAGAARVGVFASGTFRNPNSPGTAAAWTGLLGRNPGMLSFRSNANGPDSVYKFGHGDSDQIQQTLQANGINSRVLVPEGKNFSVYVFDRGRQQRDKVAAALAQLGIPAEEWRGQGEMIGGKQDDMGREQYRTQINSTESGGLVK